MSSKHHWYRVQPIGFIRRPDGAGPSSAFVDPFAEVIIAIDPRWAPGLAGIEEFSHLVVLFWLDRVSRRRVAGPLRSAEGAAGVAPVGFFATRTPRRPNPIGLSCPQLIRREGSALTVTGIDAWDGTPVIDLKGYFPRDELRSDATVPTWLTELWARHDRERSVELSSPADSGSS